MALNKKYERYAIPCINSIIKNWKNHPEILLFGNDLSENFIKWINEINNIKIIKYDEINFSNTGPVGSNIIYTKYNCWNPDIFKNFDHVLHLDCDTIILKPLDDIFINKSLFIDNNEILQNIKAFKNIDIKMCNAGIFVVHKNDISSINFNHLINLTNENLNNFLYADQSIISLWCHKNDIEISEDVYYNFQPQFINYTFKNYNFNDIKILHFAARKPDTIEFNTWWRCDGWTEKFYNIWKKYKNTL